MEQMSDVTHEPMPIRTDKPAAIVVTRVMQDLRDKAEAGIEKYGVPLHTFNGRRPLVDAYQEAIDQVLYLKQRIMEEDIDSGNDVSWSIDIDLALHEMHYKDLVEIRDLKRAMERQSADHAFELQQQHLKHERIMETLRNDKSINGYISESTRQRDVIQRQHDAIKYLVTLVDELVEVGSVAPSALERVGVIASEHLTDD
jgi:hypothetical protein